MKSNGLNFLLIMVIVISGCAFGGSTSTATLKTQLVTPSTSTSLPESATPMTTLTKTMLPLLSPKATSASIPSRTPYPTRTLTPKPSLTLTPPSTLEPKQAEEVLTKMMQEPPAPCFCDIVPGRTTLGEAKNIFSRLGIPLVSTSEWSRFYETSKEFDSGLSISTLLEIQDGVVKNITVYIDPEKEGAGVSREWLAYSPEMLIARYGSPSKVNFLVGRGPKPQYSMDMYFEALDLIIHYHSFEDTFDTTKGVFRICPLTHQFRSVRVLLGKDPENPPQGGVPLEEATTMTLGEFADLMMGDSRNACIEIKREVFP